MFFRCGDEIMEINDTVVCNMTLNDVYTVLSQCSPGPVQIIISRHPDPKVGLLSLQHKRASCAKTIYTSLWLRAVKASHLFPSQSIEML